MRTVTKGGQPERIYDCLRQSLRNPNSTDHEMNTAMGYISSSHTGPHFAAMCWVAGLLDQTSEQWYRPTAAGRQLLGAPERDDALLWRAFMALPAYRRTLEYTLLELEHANLARNAALARQVTATIDEAFPAFGPRAELLSEMLNLSLQSTEGMRTVLHPDMTLEPLATSAIQSWITEQGLGSGKTELTRAAQIAAALGATAEQPIHVEDAWLSAEQLAALVLLAAARERGHGVVIQVGTTTLLARAVEELCRGGLDIRVERQGAARVAALVPPLVLHLEGPSLLRAAVEEPDAVVCAIAEHALATVHTHRGLDGQERGDLPLEDLALQLSQEWTDRIGELTGHGAADAMFPTHSTITVGPPLPLATDLARTQPPYQFFAEALRARGQRGTPPGVAILLSPWLLQQQGAPEQQIALNAHLALLYLIAADDGGHAERLRQADSGWWLDGRPLVAALDARLRALGYEVWDEGYRTAEEQQRELGHSLVEEGQRAGVFRASGTPSAPLEAPSGYGYYEAQALLAIPTSSGSAS
jgi:hypothetical protein